MPERTVARRRGFGLDRRTRRDMLCAGISLERFVMRRIAMMVLLMVFGLVALPAPGHAQNTKALEICAKTALRQAMLLRQVTGQRDLRDKAGKVTGVELTMDVKTLGKQATVYCVYDPVKNLASISNKPAVSAAAPANDANEAVKACTRAGQQQSLMIDAVVSQADIKDAKGKVTGRTVVLSVYQAGKPARLSCDYDYAAKTTALQLRR
jgi:hypothetical protein